MLNSFQDVWNIRVNRRHGQYEILTNAYSLKLFDEIYEEIKKLYMTIMLY